MKSIKSILVLLVLVISACGNIETNEQSTDIGAKNFNVCCCVSPLNSAIGATSETDCERPCKALDKANIDWKLIDSMDTWPEYLNRFDANVKVCKEFAGLQ